VPVKTSAPFSPESPKSGFTSSDSN
jgi:hypothetical protein